MRTQRKILLTAVLCLGAIAVLATAGTTQAQTRSTNTYNILKQHVHTHVRMIRRLEKSRDYAILPKVLDRLENLGIIEIHPPVPDPGPKQEVEIINPHYVVWPDYIINNYFLVLDDLHANAVRKGDLRLVDDLAYLSRVMAIVDR